MHKLYALLLLLLVGPAAAAQESGSKNTTQPSLPAVSAEYKVGEGDVLRVEIYGEDDMSGSFTVGVGGVLNYPMLDNLVVVGKTADTISREMAQALQVSLLEDPRVSVRVERCSSQRVYVLGQVSSPGEFPLCGPTTLLEVLARAGGVTDDTVSRVRVTREGEPEQEINYDELIHLGLGNVELRHGDRIFIPEGLVVYVAGQVGQPGALPFRKGMTITQAINEAGGLTSLARTRKVFVLRDGKRLEVKLGRILRGREIDFELRPDDQVFIGESAV
ncbi:MAG: SLBB domain-containing protein [Deltaproteobacteria bacterium]|nr:SLBB domain-containing protein [Deltaproteobacteria bacterium]